MTASGTTRTNSVGSTFTFVRRALEKILKVREVGYNADLKAAVQNCLEDAKSKEELETPFDTQLCYSTFKLACESKIAVVVTEALDCLQKLLAWSVADQCVDTIVLTICDCFLGETTDENVSLQIVKALLTAVTSAQCGVHEKSLLKAVSTCYNIHLASKNMGVQITAKASLTQMLSQIFQVMESEGKKRKQTEIPITDENGNTTDNVVIDLNNLTKTVEGAISNLENKKSEKEKEEEINSTKNENDNTDDEVVTSKQTNSDDENDDENDDDNGDDDDEQKENADDNNNNNNNTNKNNNNNNNSNENNNNDNNNNNENDNDNEGGEVKHIKEDTNVEGLGSITPPATPPATPGQSTPNAGSKERPLSSSSVGSVDSIGYSKEQNVFKSIAEIDAFLVFRSLCRLSMKGGLGADTSIVQTHEIQSKILSLELLLVILQNSGPVFHGHPEFIGAIKQYLCISLSMNGVSQNSKVFELSLAIFLCLLANFKMHLKSQIEVFFKDIFLFILESSTSSFRHKWMVLQAMSRICADPQTIVDVYVNYDCDLTMDNIFNRLVNDLGKIAQGRQSSELAATPQQEESIKTKGLECLVTILSAMVEWVHGPDHAVDNGDVGSSDEGLDVENEKLSNVSTGSLGMGGYNTDNPDDLENKRKQKEIVEASIDKFNKKPKKAIAFMQEHGLVGETPEDVATFLRNDDRLDKKMIGEYLGESDKFCISVMHAYVDSIKFTDIEFLDALRFFLEGFRLPGEAQKIDRLMEKFAARFADCNPNVFAHADTAYVLAFSVIMLTTDLHMSAIKKKMTKEEFVRNNRGINDQQDLPLEFLEKIYDEIAQNEIKTKGSRFTEKINFTATQLGNEKTRQTLYSQQMEQTVDSVQMILNEKLKDNSEFIIATHIQHVKPMFSVAWTVCLASLSVPINITSDKYIMRLCLRGFTNSIHISAFFGMNLERDAFVSSLAKFTSLLSTTIDYSTLKDKQNECIKTLIHIANTEGNYLQSSWYDVLKCISKLELAQAHSFKHHDSNLPYDNSPSCDQDLGEGTWAEMSSITTSPLSSTVKMSGPLLPYKANPPSKKKGAPQRRLSQPKLMEPETVLQEVQVSVDRIFSTSFKLSSGAIMDFVKECCHVSLEELQHSNPPRMYMLQKIVEISYYNMDRIRLEWSRIWSVLGEHFNKAGCMKSMHVAMFAIDSLRQLSMKFLERGELEHFHFQKEFLRPFEHIMTHNGTQDIRELVVRCMAQMVKSQSSNLKSGWKNMFNVLSLAAGETNTEIVSLAFSTVQEIQTKNFNAVYATSFVEFLNCIMEYAVTPRAEKMNMEAVGMIRTSAKMIYENKNTTKSEDDMWSHSWLPLVLTLHRMIMRCSMDVRTRTLNVLFEILQSYGDCFTQENWIDIFSILFRIFDDHKLPENINEQRIWLETTCHITIFPLMEIITQYFDLLSPILLESFLKRLHWCLNKGNSLLASSATQCLSLLVLKNGSRFNNKLWDNTVNSVAAMFHSTTPKELMDFTLPEDGSPASLPETVFVKCVVQLELIQAVENMVLQKTAEASPDDEIEKTEEEEQQNGVYEFLGSDHITILLECLRNSHEFAQSFNSNVEQRQLLLKAKCMKKLPHLLKQEKTSQRASLAILYRVYDDKLREEIWDEVGERLIQFSMDVINSFIEEQNGKSRQPRDTWTNNLILILNRVLLFDDKKFHTHMCHYFKALTMIMCFELKQPKLRSVLSEIFCRSGMQMFSPGSTPDQTPRGSLTPRTSNNSSNNVVEKNDNIDDFE